MATRPDVPALPTDLKPKDGVLRMMPLGGLGAIGMNCCLFEYSGEIIMLDCGQMMPDEELLGIDYVIPDVTYLLNKLDRFRGIILTHAHEDHVGGLPYILPQLPKDTPVYGSELTISLLKEKMREHRLSPNFKLLHARQKVTLGKHFVVEPMAVTHSMIDAFAFAVSTPIGTFIHSGDYKMDPAPTDGVGFDFHAFSRQAEGPDEGILMLIADSTGADRPGMCPSESTTVPVLDRLIREATGQIIMATFSSSLHRIQTVLNLAAKYGRVVFPAGLNMERNIRVASSINAIEIPCEYVDDMDKAKNYPANKRLILTTGSQGEPLSGLSRMALDAHRAFRIEPNDTVILSARLIPGNEKAIYRLINHVSRRGAKVFYPGNTPGIHVSGHAYQDEMRHLYNLTNPRFLVPVHGEYRHLRAQADVAVNSGMLEEEIIIMENGDCLEVTPHAARIIGKIPHGRIFVDGKGIGDVEEVVIRDRRYLSEDGVVLVILSVSRDTGEILSGPFLHSRGFASEEEATAMMKEATEIVREAYEAMNREAQEESAVVQATIKKAMKLFLKKKTDRFPVILPVVMEV